MTLPPPPLETNAVGCPACGHHINDHSSHSDPRVDHTQVIGCLMGHPSTELCKCLWTPNDIAWQKLYGGLTRPSATPITDRVVARRSLPW
jgi:hypothetical protein